MFLHPLAADRAVDMRGVSQQKDAVAAKVLRLAAMNTKGRSPTQIGEPEASGSAVVHQPLALIEARLLVPIARHIGDDQPIPVLRQRKKRQHPILVQPDPSVTGVELVGDFQVG